MTSRLPVGWVPPVADRQHGLFTAQQARDAGATAPQVRRRRGTGRWVTVIGDALALPGTRVTAWVRAQAAGLTWPDAVVCFGSAATLHGFPVPVEEAVHVIVPNHRPSRGDLISHEIRLGPDEVVRRGLALVTTADRTLFDCIGRLPESASMSLVAWAVTRERLDRPALERALAARPHWWGNGRRRQAVLDAADGALGVAERTLHDLLRGAGLTGWSGNQRLYAGRELIGRADVLFDDVGLVIEVDGFAHHGGREQFQTDRTRQNAIIAAGYTVLRFTWADLTERPREVIAQIREMLTTLRSRHRSMIRSDVTV